MDKRSALARKRAILEAQQRSRQRRRRAIGIGAGVLVLGAVIGAIVYFAVRGNGGTPEVREIITEDLVEGTGEAAQAGHALSVYYTLRFLDGTQVESNFGGSPFKFTLGAGQVIKGWDQGLVGMKAGGTRKLTIPPDLAYGRSGSPPKIPGNTPLVFEVQLVAME